MVTMSDVAKAAGVSRATASYALRGDPRIVPATAERVMRAARELQYTTNLSARSLRSGRSGIIGVAIFELDHPYPSEMSAAMSREAVDVMLGLELGHIGINCENEAEAAKTAETIASLLSMAVKPGNSSIFVGKKEFEIMKKPGRGTNGHIAIGCNNVDRAIYHLSQRGVKFDLDSKNVKNGKTVACYMEGEIAGFAFHLVQA